MKDKHTNGKTMARKGRTKVIYKGTFISIQTLTSMKFVDGSLSDEYMTFEQFLTIEMLFRY